MDIFSALAEPTRRNIVEMLARNGQLPASEIYERFPVSAPAISQHLKVLREARIVGVEKRAQQRIYHVNAGAMQEVEAWARKVRELSELWDERFDALDEVLEAEKKQARADRDDASTLKEGSDG